MKHALLLAAVAASALSLAACGKKEAAVDATAQETAAAPESTTPAAAAMATDLAIQETAAGPIDPVPVAVALPAAAATGATAGTGAGAPPAGVGAAESTRAIVNGVALTDLYQVQAGKIAEAKAQSAAVKDFAKSMVADHTQTTNQMKHLFVVTKVPIPTELGPRGQRMIAALNAASPADFDRVYLDQQQAAQAAELTVLRVYADGGESTDIKPAAAKRIPMVQANLDKVHELQAAQTPAQ